MTDPTSECKQPETSARKTRRLYFAVLGAVCASVIGIYAWNAKSGWLEVSVSKAENNYYNQLVQGFRAGQLNLKRETSSALTQLADPYDPRANSLDWSGGMQLVDLSYYKGKFYFYFGVTPALVLFWPYVALTGHYLLHKDAAVIFFSVGFLASVGLLWAVWRRYFAEVSVGVLAAGVLALGLANFTLACLPRSGVYEVAIGCGYALTMVTLTLLWQAMHVTRGRAWWLAAASLAYGLAVGARPSLLFGAVILLVPVAMIWRARAVTGQRPQAWTLLLAATGPITVIGLGLLLYNFLRFDNPFEFGHQYALSVAGQNIVQSQIGIQPFSLRYLWFNFRVYFLEPARWSGRFPFVHDITSAPLPVGHAGVNHPFGVLTNIPLVWLALATPLVWRGRVGEPRCALRWFGVTLVLLFGICALTLGLFFAACLRYEVDFLPALVLLAVLGILGLERALAGRLVWRRGIRWGWGLLLAFSVSFNLFAMFGLSSEHYVYRGKMAFHNGHTDEAMTFLQKALDLQPENALAHKGLGMTLFREGKVPEGIRHLEEALRIEPEDAETHNNLGAPLFEMGRVPEAIGHLEQALRLKPDYVESHFNLGMVLFRQGKVAEAIGHLEEALRLKPSFGKAHDSLATALLQQGKVPEALGHFEEALRLKPEDAEEHNNVAAVLFQLGRVPEALGHFEEALRLKPDFPNARNNLAAALFQLGAGLAANDKWDEAIRQYQRSIELKPDQAQAHDNLGLALSRQGRNAGAVVHCRKALELDPQLVSALNHLAWILATETNGAIRNVEEAVRCAERACELTTNQMASSLDTLGVAYSEAGRFNEAVQASERGAAQARVAGNKDLAALIESRLNYYRKGQPYHAISQGTGP